VLCLDPARKLTELSQAPKWIKGGMERERRGGEGEEGRVREGKERKGRKGREEPHPN